jgi:DNA helicase-2/ATP-dependent DNA helicase PcrA
VPGLVEGRFPSRPSTQDPRKKKRRDWWDLVPIDAVAGGERYRGTLDDERRLFYVAITRAQRWLLLSFAPSAEFTFLNRPSSFLPWAERHPAATTRDPEVAPRAGEPTPRRGVANVTLDFTTIKDLFECPQRFRLQSLYGFSPPPDPAQGFGASIHDALAAIHRRALAGEAVTVDDVPALVADHLRLPYAPPELFEQRRDHAVKLLTAYLARHGGELDAVEFVEQPIELALGDGVTVAGRIDLVRRRDDGEASIVDFKSSSHAQGERQTQAQLHLYALGYRALTGRDARAVEVWELDEGRRDARPVDDATLDGVRAQAREAAAMLRDGRFPPCPEVDRCGRCAMRGLCGAGAAALGG